ncbi:MAG: oxygen-independent coproporphyrinogen III oxidase [Moraxellaceae bacterium]|jgi:oxygen-independent coproporphyrinogen-3 oxidase|nr:oxygen-independent coproporphyrinogen III oxidase [Moraxellaceae bacterium]MBP9729814.1 oxygen-independent coproporphyrinogen III oxidase [Moraxellaceae bacterium]MCC6199473.1 oxygen-independent coproporphyrinogen III oxidase [Moraxellaceae bacterium]HQV41386.1 oxygen-independent coproporphyrinogen III oxidase [Moraxellaceae bacterium]HQX90126.1 oxygen-independent coproporphyrinogen III oxidase [Moraxellaceae bacterium]
MNTIPPFDADLLRRYDRPGPRYTSYPTAPQFSSSFGNAEFVEVAHQSNSDPIPRQLSLYVHVPFCFSPCFYCGCNRIITRDLTRGGLYLSRLVREISLVSPLFDRDRDVIQLHLGGGTPNFLGSDYLAELVESLGRHFHFSTASNRDFSIELDPRCVNAGDIQAMAAMGFNRASLGVQDFDPAVQQAVNRVQSVEETQVVVDACRQHGFRSVNIDLIYGLPLQTREGFGRTLDTVVAMRPDRLAIYSYAHMPHMFKPQSQINSDQLPSAEDKLGLLQLAIEKLSAAGYRYIGMDHFALPEDELSLAQERGSLHRNFMGYTTHAESDLIGFGVSAISHIGNSYSQNPRDLPSWETAIEAGRRPVWRGMIMDHDDTLRADIIQQLMCQNRIDIVALEQRYGVDFATYFAADLNRLTPLQQDGLVEVSPQQIVATDRGRLLLRIVAACFDRYLHEEAVEKVRFSRVI